jgi:hypothetical protein
MFSPPSCADRARSSGTPSPGRARPAQVVDVGCRRCSIVPEVMSSRPAIRRSSVDLPQPDGPTKTTNSPSLMSRSIPGMMSVAPNDFLTFFSTTTSAHGVLPDALFDGAEGQAADQLPSAEPAHDQDRRDGQRRRGADSLAQNRPCGLENEAMKAVSGAALVVERRIVQNASFQARMMLSSMVEAMPGTAIGSSTYKTIPAARRRPSVPASRISPGHFAEIGVEHPHHDRQVDQRVA